MGSPRLDMGTTGWTVPVSRRYNLQPHALEVVGSIASIADDAGCTLTTKGSFAGGAWGVLQ